MTTRSFYLSRREAISLPLAAWLATKSRGLTGQEPLPQRNTTPAEPTFPGMIVRMHQPLNLEFPISALRDFETPTEQFYIRNHFPVPSFTPENYRLSVEGDVEQPKEFSLKELAALGQTTQSVTLECAGNGRIFLVPQAAGLQWGFGGVGTARWTGTPLAAVLDHVRVKPNATEVLLVGADRGSVSREPQTPGAIPFDRSIPLAKARREETILATEMNGEPLTPNHGAPARAIVGGWYGMASIKWLQRIIVLSKPYQGYWQTMDYAYYERVQGLPSLTVLDRMQPKAVLARPGLGDVVPVNQEIKLCGAAWAGEEAVERVEYSVDGGKTWRACRCTTDAKPFVWRLWEAVWTPTSRGPATILVKATDRKGNTQPEKRDPDRRSYMINHLIPVEVLVR